MNIIESFITNNENFADKRQIAPKGIMIHSVGTPQPNPEVFVRIFNTPRPNSRQAGVHAFLGADDNVWQTLPWRHRAWHAGGAANDTHIGIEMTEPDTIRYTSGSNFSDLNPAATRKFVHQTYANATRLFAHLCKLFSLDPLADGVIISHAEGHRRGIASNHGDVEHIWRHFDLTMPQFRQDIAKAMKGEVEDIAPPRFNTLKEMPSWALPTIKKLIDKGHLKGDENGNLDLSLDMIRIFVIHDRAGLYDS